METAQVAGTLVESRGGTGATASEVAQANAGQDCCWAGGVRVELGRSGSVWVLYDSRWPLKG